MYVIVTNDVNWHRENLRSDRENTGNLKTQFEWVPWVNQFIAFYKLLQNSIGSGLLNENDDAILCC